MPNLLEQVRRTGSGYLMITGSSKFPGILGLPQVLQESSAFEIVHTEGSPGARGVVLLKSTGRPPEAVRPPCAGGARRACSPPWDCR
jgi:hypothetical protein